MINEIKTIVQNYLSNAKLCGLVLGTVEADGIRISDKLVVPMELISGNLKDFVKPGDKVKLIRNNGGQEFYITEIMGLVNIFEDATIEIEPIVIGDTTITSIKIKDVMRQ